MWNCSGCPDGGCLGQAGALQRLALQLSPFVWYSARRYTTNYLSRSRSRSRCNRKDDNLPLCWPSCMPASLARSLAHSLTFGQMTKIFLTIFLDVFIHIKMLELKKKISVFQTYFWCCDLGKIILCCCFFRRSSRVTESYKYRLHCLRKVGWHGWHVWSGTHLTHCGLVTPYGL